MKDQKTQSDRIASLISSEHGETADKTVDIWMIEDDQDGRKSIIAYNHGNGYVKLFESIYGFMNYHNASGEFTSHDVTQDEYDSEDFHLELLKLF